MDHQAFVDCVALPCAVLSVARGGEGGYGEIRICRANRAYRAMMGPEYRDGMIYSELVPRELKFEDYCYRAAIKGERTRACIEMPGMDCWTDILLLPLRSDDPKVGYCQFMVEYTQSPEANRQATVSTETATAVIRACIALMSGDDFMRGVSMVLQDLLDISGAYSCRILLVDHDRREATNYCECMREMPQGYNPQVHGVLPYALVKSWEDVTGVSNAVIIRDAQGLKELEAHNPEWARSLRRYGVTSLILIPLRRESAIIGWLYMVNFNVEKALALRELVELLSYFLGSEISKHMMMEQLKVMSHTDALTGINNRNAMIRRMKDVAAEGKPYGIVNLDVNGLKGINDASGHEAGDRLLVRAAQTLRKVFYAEDIYRTGGDEFIVVATGITEEALARKVRRLRASAEKADVSFAVGVYWSDGSTEVNNAFRLADARMYMDKQAYYEGHPEERR